MPAPPVVHRNRPDPQPHGAPDMVLRMWDFVNGAPAELEIHCPRDGFVLVNGQILSEWHQRYVPLRKDGRGPAWGR